MDQYFPILSIDGGGIRGIIPAMVLEEIERRTGRPICDLFRLIAGTSTGGLLALGLSLDDGSKRPKYSAAAMVGVYRDDGETIFHQTILREVVSPLVGPKYSAGGIERVLQGRFGAARLKDALGDVLIPSYDIEKGRAEVFKSRSARENPERDFPMWRIARATSAAPTFFPPEKLVPEDKSQPYYALVDGGVYANNPTLVAFAEAREKLLGPDERTLVVSLGTGELTSPIPYDEACEWGSLEWVAPIINVLFSQQSASVDAAMRHLCRTLNAPKLYYRIQGALDQSDDALDNASAANIQALQNVALNIIADNRAAIDELCELLVKCADLRRSSAG